MIATIETNQSTKIANKRKEIAAELGVMMRDIDIDLAKQKKRLDDKIKKRNPYNQSFDSTKAESREILFDKLMNKFDFKKHNTLDIVTLGGEDMITEKILSRFYSLRGFSYEMIKVSKKKAEKNAPQGIKVELGNILNHKFTGKENFVWFDFMKALRPENIIEDVTALQKNPIKSNSIVAFTYTLRSRKAGYGEKQIWGNDVNMMKAIVDMGNILGMNLENEFVKPISLDVCKYKCEGHSLPMVLYIFDLVKK